MTAVIPLKDDNPTRGKPLITVALVIACVAVYFGFQRGGDQTEFTYRRAAVPCEVVTGSPMTVVEIATGDCTRHDVNEPVFPDKNVVAALITSMFLHGGLVHLGGNMLYLWVFGNNIEDTMGKAVYVVFYIAAGVVATFAHIAVDPGSTVPLVGASGAIAGVMGAYLVLFPRVRIHSIIVFFLILFRDIEARWLLGFWFLSQFFINPNEGVAWAAHVGGFAFGVVAGLVWKARGGGAAPERRRYVVSPPYA